MQYCKKKILMRNAVFIIALVATGYSQCAFAYDNQLRLNLDTCLPEGIIGIAKEKLSPRSFWVSQTVVLEMALERSWEFTDSISACQSEGTNAEKARCRLYFQNRLSSIRKCHRTATIMCKQNGAC